MQTNNLEYIIFVQIERFSIYTEVARNWIKGLKIILETYSWKMIGIRITRKEMRCLCDTVECTRA